MFKTEPHTGAECLIEGTNNFYLKLRGVKIIKWLPFNSIIYPSISILTGHCVSVLAILLILLLANYGEFRPASYN